MSEPRGDGTGRGRIDVHQHVLPPQFVDSTPMPMQVPDTDTHIRALDELGIRTAITSLTPRVFLQNGSRRREVARACNEFQAGMVRDHPDRFGSFAVLPLPDVDGALAEVAYALDELRMDGVGLFSSQEGRYLGDPLYEPLFEELNRRKAVVFVHPAHCSAPPELNLRAPGATIEYIFDTTRAIVNLLYNGTLRRYPDLRMIFSHGGGTVPYLTFRISRMEASGNVENVVGTLQSLYYDLATAMVPYVLRSLQELVDPSHILWGTDYPFAQGPHLHEEIEIWETYDGLDAAGRAAVERGNALRLFPRLAATSKVS